MTQPHVTQKEAKEALQNLWNAANLDITYAVDLERIVRFIDHPPAMPSREEVAETIFRAQWPHDKRPWVRNEDGSPQEYQKAFLASADAILKLFQGRG